jgi:hypothetical protein
MTNYEKLNGEVAYDIGCEIEKLRTVLFQSIELDDRPELRKYVQKQVHHSLEYHIQVLKSVKSSSSKDPNKIAMDSPRVL